MTNLRKKKQGLRSEGEKERDELSYMLGLIDAHTRGDPDKWGETYIEAEGSPQILRTKREGGYVLQISAMPSEEIAAPTYGIKDIPEQWVPDEQEILDVLEESQAPAVTASELCSELGVDEDSLQYQLERLEAAGYIQSHDSDGTRLWWKDRNLPDTASEEDEEELPEKLKELLEEEKTEMESIIDTYNRIRGNPHPRMISELVGDIELDVEEVREAIEAKRKTEANRREEIRKRFE